METNEKTDNELIAEFDGWIKDPVKFPNNGKVNWWHPERSTKVWETVFPTTSNQFKYHTSWDWLMPVVKKINELNEEWFAVILYQNDCNICNIQQAVVYKSVVEFIKWYNENKK